MKNKTEYQRPACLWKEEGETNLILVHHHKIHADEVDAGPTPLSHHSSIANVEGN